MPTTRFRGRKAPNRSEVDARNRKLGLAGEMLVLDYEKRRLSEAGREDLAAGVRHVAAKEGDGAGYDIQSFTDDGAICHIEVKTTSGPAETDFFITENELEFSRENEKTYFLYRVYDCRTDLPSGRYYMARAPLAAEFTIRPTRYRAKR